MLRATEVEKVPPPIETQSGNFVYYSKTSTNGSKLYCRRLVANANSEQILVDSSMLAAEHGCEIKNVLVSDNHRYIGCMVTDNDGPHTETCNLMVYLIEDTGKAKHLETLTDVFNFVFGTDEMLFYTVLNDKLRAHKICCHQIGKPQHTDTDIFTEQDDECFVDVTRTKDAKFIIINSSTLDSSEVRVFPVSDIVLEKAGKPNTKLLRSRQRGVEYFADHYGEEFVILTNSPLDDSLLSLKGHTLPFRLMKAPSACPESGNWRELLSVADDEKIEDVEIFRDYIMITVKRQGRPAVIVHDRVANTNAELQLPNRGNCVVRPGANPQFDTTIARLSFSSPVHMDSVIEYNLKTLKACKQWASVPLHMDTDEYVIHRECVENNNVSIPMTLIHHKSVDLAHGGGSELGREWYSAGKGQNKSNSVSDLLHCAQSLLERGWTTPEKLAVAGISAGGLVVGAALNRSPEYFRAAALHVPFVDPLSAMLNPDLPLTKVETAEWGNPATSVSDYKTIQSYAPYDNIRNARSDRPSILVTAGGLDQRVSVWQPAKWVARLRDRGGYSSATGAQLLFFPRRNEGHFYSEANRDDGGYIKVHSLLEKTPYDYSIYIQWIKLLREVGDIESMRAARQQMCSNLSVPEDLVLEWVADEEAQPDYLLSETVLTNIVDLYELALRDRLSVIMWQRYIDFIAGLVRSRIANVRDTATVVLGSGDAILLVLRRAIDATCTHYLQSQALWSQYCDYIEQKISKADDKDKSELIELLQAVFLERLAQPHTGLEDTFAMYSEFTTKYNEAHYEQQMVEANKMVSNTRAQCKLRNSFEDSLIASGGSWHAYAQYIDRLAKDKRTNPNEISMLYERALVYNCYVVEIWSEYISFLDGAFDDKSLALKTAHRAIRNCPWSGKLWAQTIHFTFVQAGKDQAEEAFMRASSTHAVTYSMVEFGQAAVAWIAVLRLSVAANLSSESDLLAECEKCMDIAYSLDMNTADPLLFFERCCTNAVSEVSEGVEVARKMWIRICKARKVCTEAWLLSVGFEKVHGTVSSTRSVYRHAAQRKLDSPERLFDSWLAFENSVGYVPEIYAAERVINAQRHLIQRKMEQETNVPAKRPRSATPEPANMQVSGGNDLMAESANANVASHETSKAAEDINTTIYIKGLPSTYTTTQIEEFLGGSASVDNVAPITDKQGEFHGQAKAVLKSAAAVIAALDKNGTSIDGRFVSIHIYKSDHRSHRKPPVVEVCGFATGTSNKQIEEIAKSAGTVIRVRRNQPGDTAFVTMKTYQDAVKAKDALDGCEVDGEQLRATLTSSDANLKSAPKRQDKAPPQGKAVVLAPRKAATKRPVKKVNVQTRASGPAPAADSSSVAASDKKMTNSDFRQIFLNSKSDSPT
ncbi:hypothetical protein IWW42_001196 [Coemansia sp. RSA 1085]|nr:hypothetical protein IWW42_001196 [Coemansia sp. RSA 1085]